MRLFSRKSKIQSTAQNVDKATSSDDYFVQFPQCFTLLVLEQARLQVKKLFNVEKWEKNSPEKTVQHFLEWNKDVLSLNSVCISGSYFEHKIHSLKLRIHL